MKVLFLVPRLNNAGPINQMYNLVSNVNRNIVQLWIVTMYFELEDSKISDFQNLGIPIEYLKLKHKYFNLNDGEKFEKILKKISPDIVHSETLPADLLMRKVKNKPLWCTTIHCNIFNDYPIRFKKGLAEVFIYMHRKCLKNIDQLICCSKTLKRDYDFYGYNSVAIQNGVDIEKYRIYDEYDHSYWRTQLKLPQDKKIILIVGSIDYRKRSLFIINALKDVLKKMDAKLIFCGEGKDMEKCKLAAEGYDIEFRGQVNNIIPYLQAADIYLSASASEGLPMSVIEAGCCGAQLLLSNISQHLELQVDTNETTINYFVIDNKESLLSSMNDMLRDNEMGSKEKRKNISTYFSKYFSAKIMAEQYMQKYVELLNKEKL